MDARVIDEPLAEQHHGNERRTQQRHPQLVKASRLWLDHSSSPRRIASATAAARSDTPSFSYNRAW